MKPRHLASLWLVVALITGATGSTALPTPGSFRQISLGMELEAVKAALIMEPFFDYRGDPDVSFLPLTKQPLIESAGTSFVDRGYFQFHDGRLFIMTIVMDTDLLDYFTMFQRLSARYGDPADLDPTAARWDVADVRVSLERPLSVKYFSVPVLERLLSESEVGAEFRALEQEAFLSLF